MGSTERGLTDILEAATSPAQAGVTFPNARYLLLSPSHTLETLSALIDALTGKSKGGWVLTPMKGDSDVFILAHPTRFFADSATAFDSAYALQDLLKVDAVEPDLPTDVYARAQDPPAEDNPMEAEGTESAFWCWEDIEQELEKTRRWALDAINIPSAWDTAGMHRQGLGVILAQPDTGVTDHQLLQNRPTLPGYDFVDNKEGAVDPISGNGDSSHGTGTGSVAVGNEHTTMSGAAPRATHLPIRAIRSVIRITQGSVAEAIHYAVTNEAHVISMSLGGVPSFALRRAIERAVTANLIVIAAAGNCVGFAVWPARYEACIGVAATNRHGKMWKGSSHGKSVDISAPGENVFRARATRTNGKIDFGCGQGQGTSFATALTAGVAACWLAHHGRDTVVSAARSQGLSVQALFKRLLQNTSSKPELPWPTDMGAGLINADALLKAPLVAHQAAESAHAIEDDAEAYVNSVRELLFEATGKVPDPDLDLLRYGPEISLAVLKSAKRQRDHQPETAAQAEAAGAETLKALSEELSAVVFGHPTVVQAIAAPIYHADRLFPPPTE